tara:strand:+ start:1030 stop:1998 length:969 start_codon:yes stop_codon:yes gene_type:complete
MTYEIIDLPEGELITEPGFYRISLDRHHNQPCDGVSVTSGVLRKMNKHGPSKVWATHILNPNRHEPKRTDALRLGSAMAAFIEGGIDGLNAEYQTVAENAPNRPTKAQLQALKEGRASKTAIASIAFWEEVDRDGREVIKEHELELMAAMGLALSQDPAASAVLGGEPEITMTAYDERNKLWLLSRPDNMNFQGLMSDYKKVNTQGAPFDGYFCDRRIEDHGYYCQMAFAADVFERLTGVWSDQSGLIFQEDTAPYDCILRGLSEEDLRFGQFLNNQAARQFRECLDANHWPGPGEVVGMFHMREERRLALLEQMQTAGLAP